MKYALGLLVLVLAGTANAQCPSHCAVAVVQPAFQVRKVFVQRADVIAVPVASNNIAINTGRRGLFGRNQASVAISQNGAGFSNNVAVNTGRRR